MKNTRNTSKVPSAGKQSSVPCPDVTPDCNLPYMLGVYLAVNAVSDAYLLTDGPSCLFYKAEYIQGSHDWTSTLLSCDGRHRVHHTDADTRSVTHGSGAAAGRAIEDMASLKDCGALFVSSLPFCKVASVDYGRIASGARKRFGKPVMNIRGNSLSGDWLEGYGDVMECLASGIELGKTAKKPGTVAIAGYMMDRGEGDHRGNVAELERMLKALSLKVSCVWFSGEPCRKLREAASAEAIISLPHSRKAASILAERTGARLIETCIPLGLDGTRRWLTDIGEKLGRRRQAERFVDMELKKTVPTMEWAAPHVFLNRNFVFAGDPYYAVSFKRFVEELGGRVKAVFCLGDPARVSKACRAELEKTDVCFNPKEKALKEKWLLLEKSADIIVAPSHILEVLKPRIPWVELGYPSRRTHFLDESPVLGFRGCLNLSQRIANAVMAAP